LLLNHSWRGRSELYRLELRSNVLERVDTPRGTILGARIRPDGELWYAITSSASPPSIVCGRTPFTPRRAPAPSGVGYIDLDVGNVHAFLAKPKGSGPHPTVVHLHGGPARFSADMFSPAVQAWVDHGFAVVSVNYRGGAGQGKNWRDRAVDLPGLSELEDIAAVHDFLVERDIADGTRIVLSGYSWGGFLTLLALGRQPERWSLGIAQAPLADLTRLYEEQSVPRRAYWRAMFGGTPEDIRSVLPAIDPIRFAGHVRVPVMIFAGDNDARSPIGQVLSYVGRLRASGATVQLHRYDGGHRLITTDEQIHQMELRLHFTSRHLGTPTPA